MLEGKCGGLTQVHSVSVHCGSNSVFGISRGAKMSSQKGALHSSLNSTSEHAPQVIKITDILCKTNLWKIVGDQLPKISPMR